SARAPHSGSSSARSEPAARGSSVPIPPSRITQRWAAIFSAMCAYAPTARVSLISSSPYPFGKVSVAGALLGKLQRLGAREGRDRGIALERHLEAHLLAVGGLRQAALDVRVADAVVVGEAAGPPPLLRRHRGLALAGGARGHAVGNSEPHV